MTGHHPQQSWRSADSSSIILNVENSVGRVSTLNLVWERLSRSIDCFSMLTRVSEIHFDYLCSNVFYCLPWNLYRILYLELCVGADISLNFECFSILTRVLEKKWSTFPDFFSNFFGFLLMKTVWIDFWFWIKSGSGYLVQICLLFDYDSSFGNPILDV